MKLDHQHYEVVILGAGAAGLICAFTAAQRGRRVLLLEKANKIGKKILMSGGGRCNFTNQFVTAENYLSHNPHFCKSALNRYTQWDFINLVESHGIEYEERKHGQLFCKQSANDILLMLLEECKSAGVEVKTHCEINELHKLPLAENPQVDSPDNQPCRFRLELTEKRKDSSTSYNIHCQTVVVATGALSIPTLGGSGWGYDIAQQFDLSVTETRAGLVPFMFTDSLKPLCEGLSGLSVDAEVSCNGKQFSEAMLFTHRGISGPVILQISSYWNPGDVININLLPNTDAPEWLVSSKQQQGKIRLKTLLIHRLPKALATELENLWWPLMSTKPLAEFSDRQLITIGQLLNDWRLKPSATEGYRTAEVTLGGVNTDGISSKTMETKQQPGLYFIGEVLDVSGHLGGFNFQWAWSSGYTAGLFV